MERTNRNLWIGLAIVALVLLAASSWGGGMLFGRGLVGFGPRPFVGGPAPWLFGFMGLGLLVRLLFFGLIAFVVLRVFRAAGGRSYRFDDEPYTALPPAEILRRRYAAGEISREQFEEMRRTLEPTPA